MSEKDIMLYVDSFDTAKSCLESFGLELMEKNISYPKVKTTCIHVPFSDSVIDLSEVDGHIYYKQRKLHMKFKFVGNDYQWNNIKLQLSAFIHGKRIKIVDMDDPGFFYIGRINMDANVCDNVRIITVEGLMDPYKYELFSSVEDWLWDVFDFESGVVREYKDMVVSESMTVEIPGTGVDIVPVITCSAAMNVSFEGTVFSLLPGRNMNNELRIKPGVNTLIFMGNGNVSIEYRGRWL